MRKGHFWNPNFNYWLQGLPKNWTKKDLEGAFRQYGIIRNARILLDPATQMGTGVGFLLYAKKDMAEKACEVQKFLFQTIFGNFRGFFEYL